jgi:hypothetical protein
MNLMATTFDKPDIDGILNVLEGGDSNIDMGRGLISFVVCISVHSSHIDL